MSKNNKKDKKSSKVGTVVLVMLLILVLGAVGAVYFLIYRPEGEQGKTAKVEYPDPIYSVLTGEEIDDEKLNQNPTFCIQIPNGSTDGARPQAGLTKAGIVFEAIAETGITRFAAVFQNANLSAIGPVRSLRPYYLDWDTPFDCTVVHAGGSDEALAAIRRGGQRNLDEDNRYMWRENNTGRLWNNLFTSSKKLMEFNEKNNYKTSQVKAFNRATPEETEVEINKKRECLEKEVCEIELASEVNITFTTYSPTHNVQYVYDEGNNRYLRYHGDGKAHMSYVCVGGNEPNTKTECGEAVQVAPKVVAVMRVKESTMADNYHEQITTIGSGKAIIFQNGEVISGTWSKASQKEQIVFRDNNGEEIKLTAGQLFVEAVPQFGRVEYSVREE